MWHLNASSHTQAKCATYVQRPTLVAQRVADVIRRRGSLDVLEEKRENVYKISVHTAVVIDLIHSLLIDYR